MNKPSVLPVIHIQYLNKNLALDQADMAFECGADGVFFISHEGKDIAVVETAIATKEKYPDKKIGINLLSTSVIGAYRAAEKYNLDMVWFDNCGVTSDGITDVTEEIIDAMRESSERDTDIYVFASVAFKYQKEEKNPYLAAKIARECHFIPTTSGSATGIAADLNKVISMSQCYEPLYLAIASGMTCENVKEYVPYLSHILVATGVCVDDDFHRFDYEKLRRFVAIVKQ